MGAEYCAETRHTPKDGLRFMTGAEVAAQEKDGKIKWLNLDCSDDDKALDEYKFQRMRDAVFFDSKAFWAEQTAAELDVDKMAKYFENLKVGKDLNVLCYDKNDGVAAVKLAVYMRLYGFKHVAVLNEKFQTQEEHKRSEAEQPVDTKGTGADFKFELDKELVATKEAIQKIYDGAIGYIIDARTPVQIKEQGKLDTCKPYDATKEKELIAETED
jgi:3-mercaptopyruvate sulfurtransferase SseA